MELSSCRVALTWAVLGLLTCDITYAYGVVESGGKKGCWFSNLAGKEGNERSQQHSRRQLLQSNCALQLGNDQLAFTSCMSLSSQLGTDMRVLWTVVDQGMGNSTLRAAIDAAYSAGDIDWAAFGFNPELEMIDGNALLVRSCRNCSSGASIDDYYLADYEASAVTPPSRLAVGSKTAALSNGRLVGVFELSLNAAGNSLSSVGALFAAGPLGSSGELEQHTYQLAENLDLSPGAAETLGPALAPASGGGSPAQAPGPQESATSPSSSAVTAAGSSAAVAPAPNGQGCTLQFAGNNSVLTFAQCQSLTTSSSSNSGFRLLWNISPSSSGNGSEMVGAISATASGWAGLGFATQPGEMLGAHAIIVKPCSTCASGASADRYLLSSYETSGVVAGTGNLNLRDVQAARNSDGTIQAVFTAALAESGISASSPANIIAAVGPVSGGDSTLQQHPLTSAYSGTIDLQSGSIEVAESTEDRKPKVHAIMMIVSWGLLLPLGVVFPRFKEWGSIWFQLHRAVQVIGYLAGVAGAAVGVAIGRPNKTKLENNHRIVGLVVFILLTIQATAVLWRPAPRANKLRYSWNGLHWFLGGAAIFMAFSNVLIGLHISGQPRKWSGLYALGFGLIFLIWLGKLAVTPFIGRSRRRSRKLTGTSSTEPLHGGPNPKHPNAQRMKGSSEDSNGSSENPNV